MVKVMRFCLKTLLTSLVAAILVIAAVVGVFQLFPVHYADEIRQACETNDLNPYLVAALIRAESHFDPLAVSSADAKGLMQLTDATAQFCADALRLELAEGDVFQPATSITLGTWYLSRLLGRYEGDVTCAIAAYNAGEGNVDRWLSDTAYSDDGKTLREIPYGETKRHVEKIEIYTKIYRLLYPHLF